MPSRVVILGVDYINFQVAEWMQANKLGEIVAFIDDEPWNHKTHLLKAPLKYPSELLALCDKHKVNVVISFSSQKIALNKAQITKLIDLNVHAIELDSQSDLEELKHSLLNYLNSPSR